LQKPWQHWVERDWNNFLFGHYFHASADDAPVSRLVVTGRELAQAARCEPEKADEVERRFVSVILRSPNQFNLQFQGVSLSTGSLKEPPPVVLYLLFSCYVASGNEQVISVGDFRRRMAKVLGHPPGTNYPLEGLAPLWKSLQRWLSRARAAGYAYRELLLPPPDWRTRIGYSIRLAFPQRCDQMILNEIIPVAGFAAQPPIPALIRLLGRYLDRFSESFLGAYEEFRRAFLDGCDDFSWSPLLDAVREAMAQRSETAPQEACPDLLLVGEPDEKGRLTLMLLSDRGKLPAHSCDLVTVETEYGVGTHRFVLGFNSPDSTGADAVIEFLLADRLSKMLPGFATSPLRHSAAEGVLLFCRGASGIFECRLNLELEGKVYVLVRHDLCAAFEHALAGIIKPLPRGLVSAYTGWFEFGGVEAALLRSIQWGNHGVLDDVRCLQRSALASRITLSGGIATGESQTFFGHPAVLPAVRVRGRADLVTMTQVGKIERELELALDDDGLFKIRNADEREPLEGEYVIKASLSGAHNRTLQKHLRLRAFVDRYDYIRPSQPQKWLCESVRADMVTWNPDAAFGGAPAGPMVGKHRALSHAVAPRYSSDYTGQVALTEICAAIAARRCGFTEGELVELFGAVLKIKRHALIRLVLRAWVEAGYLDEAIDVSWRARRYFACSPRLVLRAEGGQVLARVVGLSPAVLLNHLRARVEQLGGTVVQYSSLSQWVDGPWEVCGLGAAQFSELASELRLGEPLWAPGLSKLILPLQNLERHLKQEPMNYEQVEIWSWDRHRFVESRGPGSTPVEVELHRRKGRLDRPDYYLVRRNCKPALVTYSRNWALLFAARFRRQQPYRNEAGVLVSDGYPWMFLPLSIGRFAFAAGAGPSGPRADDTVHLRYCYPIGSKELAADLLARLGISDGAPTDILPPWLEALAATRAQTEPMVPLERGTLGRRRVPVSLRQLMLAHSRCRQRSHL
jgi:hypothetical protein